METLYKLTDADGYTRRGQLGETSWQPGKLVTVEWGGHLCEAGCLHAYRHPLLAVLFDPEHARLLPSGKLWSARGNVRDEDATKAGCDSLEVVEQVDVPTMTTAQRVRWAILCAQQLPQSEAWQRWAKSWLDGADRTAAAADAVADAAYAAIYAVAAYAADAVDACAVSLTWHDLLRLAEQAIREEQT